MSLVPALCLTCSRVTLVPLTQARQRDVTCKLCGADARVAPSCSYSERDREQFEELSEVVAEANTTSQEARGLAEAVQRALWSQTYAPTIERLCARMPGLLPMQIAAGDSSPGQRHILVKLQSILQALASAVRGGSAEYSIVSEAGESRHVSKA